MGIAAAMTNHECNGRRQGKLAANIGEVLQPNPVVANPVMANPVMGSVFSALPPSPKANYPRWIEESEMTDTRRHHIALMIKHLTHEDAR
jgi:hypothetical protein